MFVTFRAGFRNSLSQFEPVFKGLESGVETSQTTLREPLILWVGTQGAARISVHNREPLGLVPSAVKNSTWSDIATLDKTEWFQYLGVS